MDSFNASYLSSMRWIYIYKKMPIKDPSINPPITAPFWKVRMLKGVDLTNVGQEDNEEKVFSTATHITRSNGLNRILFFFLLYSIIFSSSFFLFSYAELSMSDNIETEDATKQIIWFSSKMD
ncbi:unnamed protein product [Brassica oleracea]|uniref:(rape) hypothetical protein n=1 Tax=Brassica napus TaxID=3708 RepID=A0A816LWM9_BRANA|nr:unnamed protein product [Brassica napus]